MSRPQPVSRHPSAASASEARLSLRPQEPVDEPADTRAAVEALSDELGPATEAEVQTLLGPVSGEQLVAAGREVKTSRVSDEAVRVVRTARAFYAAATPERAALVRMSPDVLRVVAWSAAQGHRAARRLHEARAAKRERRAVSARAVATALDRARTERDQLAGALRSVHAGDPEALARVTAAERPAAMGRPESGAGRALADLVAIAREALSGKDEGVAARCALWHVTPTWLQRCDGIASRALAAEQADAAPSVDLVELQALVDRWEGVNVALLGRVVGAFARAHDADPSVPKIQLVSLRNILGSRRGGRRADPANPPPAPPSPPSPSPGGDPTPR